MATTSIWAIKGGAGAIHRVETYIENPEKTCQEKELGYQHELHQVMLNDQLTAQYSIEELQHEIACYVSGVNCTAPNDAWEEFTAVYDAWEKPCQGRVCYHGYQSFKEGEVNADQAHTIGVRLAEQLWGDRFQVVVATHLNTGHYHNHFLLNAISFADGKKFVNRKSDYRRMREISDELCRAYGLSVIQQPEHNRGKHYGEWKAQQDGRPTDRGEIRSDLESVLQYMVSGSVKDSSGTKPGVRRDIRTDLDDAAMQASTMKELVSQMESRGYIWDFTGKYPKIKPPGKDRFFRLHKLGEGYDSLETLARRVLEMQQKPVQTKKLPQTRYRYHGSFKKRKKSTGFLALYYYHCYRVGVFQKRKYPKYTPEYRAAQKQIHEMTKVTVFLRAAGIHNLTDLQQYQGKITQRLKECDAAVSEVHQKLVQSSDPQENRQLVAQLDAWQEKRQMLLEQKKLCRMVEEQQPRRQTEHLDQEKNMQI